MTSTISVGSGLGVEVRELRSANSFPMVRFCKVCSEDISSSTLKGFSVVLVGADRETVLVLLLALSGVVDLVTLEVTVCEVLGDEVIILKSVPTCVSVDVLLSA